MGPKVYQPMWLLSFLGCNSAAPALVIEFVSPT
jgi:hypothetical protein